MAYNPNLYNPYGSQQFQPTISFPQQTQPTFQPQQPINGLIWIDGIQGAQMYPLPPNSTSPPLMFKNESKFAVKTTDGGGAGSVRLFSFTEDEPTPDPSTNANYVTHDDFESFKKEIMEAINGKPAVPAE